MVVVKPGAGNQGRSCHKENPVFRIESLRDAKLHIKVKGASHHGDTKECTGYSLNYVRLRVGEFLTTKGCSYMGHRYWNVCNVLHLVWRMQAQLGRYQ